MKRNRNISLIAILLLLVSVTACLPIPDMHWTGDGIGVGCYGDIVPCTSYVSDLGSALYQWHNAYIETVRTVVINSNAQDLYIDCGVNHTIVLSQPVWDDLSLSMSNVKTPAANAPNWRYFQGTEIPAFSATQINVLYFTTQLPHSYLEGSNIEFHIHTVCPDALAGNIRWHFTYSWANINDNFVAPTNTTITVASSGVANKHQLYSIVPSMNGAGKKISSVIVCSIQRLGTDGLDTYPSEIYLVSGDFHFQKDTIGSRQELIK